MVQDGKGIGECESHSCMPNNQTNCSLKRFKRERSNVEAIAHVTMIPRAQCRDVHRMTQTSQTTYEYWSQQGGSELAPILVPSAPFLTKNIPRGWLWDVVGDKSVSSADQARDSGTVSDPWMI